MVQAIVELAKFPVLILAKNKKKFYLCSNYPGNNNFCTHYASEFPGI